MLAGLRRSLARHVATVSMFLLQIDRWIAGKKA
jgi:hypothetical protein